MSEPRAGEIVEVEPRRNRPPAAITPMQMLQTAVERGADVAMLEKLLALQERWEATEARKAFVTALSAFKAKPPSVTKNKHVDAGRMQYDHATLDQVSGVIGEALSQHGLSHRWEVDQADGMIRVTCVLTHELGHSERVSLQAGADNSGSKNTIQAIGSTVTYLERYTLLAATGLAAKDQDNDAGAMRALISAEQKAALVALQTETGTDTKRFLTYMGVATLDELPAAEFENAKAALEKKRSAK